MVATCRVPGGTHLRHFNHILPILPWLFVETAVPLQVAAHLWLMMVLMGKLLSPRKKEIGHIYSVGVWVMFAVVAISAAVAMRWKQGMAQAGTREGRERGRTHRWKPARHTCQRQCRTCWCPLRISKGSPRTCPT